MRFGLPQPIYQHSIDGLRLLYCRVGPERRDLRSVQALVRQMGASEGEEWPLRHISIVTQRRKKHTQKGKALFWAWRPWSTESQSGLIGGETDCPDTTNARAE
jgi:hypothetical protein